MLTLACLTVTLPNPRVRKLIRALRWISQINKFDGNIRIGSKQSDKLLRNLHNIQQVNVKIIAEDCSLFACEHQLISLLFKRCFRGFFSIVVERPFLESFKNRTVWYFYGWRQCSCFIWLYWTGAPSTWPPGVSVSMKLAVEHFNPYVTAFFVIEHLSFTQFLREC